MRGTNVLYMDGHVQFIRDPQEEQPVDEGFASIIGAAQGASLTPKQHCIAP